MATKKEEPIVDNDTGSLKVKEKVAKQPDGNETKGNVTKVKEKMKKPAQTIEETITKVDLSKPVEKAETVEPTKTVVEVVEEPALPTEEALVVEEITNEEQVEEIADTVQEAIAESIEAGVDLPENIQKLMNFMEDTGGDLNDFVTLNQDYSELDNHTLLKEYYKSTKPHLSEDEVDFVMEDTFAYDEDMDEDRDVKRKKLAMKEQVAEAKLHLESVKSKYYEDIKSGSKLTSEQQEAINFFTEYNEESGRTRDAQKKQSDTFAKKTNQLFNEDFKGFEYNVGEKRFRINVKDKQNVRKDQGDINNFIKKFLNEDDVMEDANGYHKSLFTAMNADVVANHFYEQGKSDALKESIAKSKNVDMSPRQSLAQNTNTSGFTVRALDNDNTSDFKFKIKNK